MKEVAKVLIIIVLMIVFCLGIYTGIKIYKNGGLKLNVENHKKESEVVVLEDEEEKEQFQIYNGKDRPIAFMIDNNRNAQPQASINKAYMVYEIIVEGNETRLMALFKGAEVDMVGPIRSARHYFLDYAMENDAIYAHLGMSPQAERDLALFKINSMNGQAYDTGKARTETARYWREGHKNAPHNAYTNIPSILSISKEKGYRVTSDNESVLNYVKEEVNLETEDAIIANTVTIPYSSSHKVKYVYDAESGRYTRWSKGKKMYDETTDEEITTKNVIITFAENYTLDDGEDKGRQDVITVGELDGYYITNGKAIPIKCIKTSRETKTLYQDLNGKEINVNDGNTFVNICPIDAEVVINETL